jgi:hypothetical protein
MRERSRTQAYTGGTRESRLRDARHLPGAGETGLAIRQAAQYSISANVAVPPRVLRCSPTPGNCAPQFERRTHMLHS